MPISYWTLGKKYLITVTDPETGEEVDRVESYYYGIETDATDYWHRMSMLAPDDRDAKRATHGQPAPNDILASLEAVIDKFTSYERVKKESKMLNPIWDAEDALMNELRSAGKMIVKAKA